MKEIVMEKTCWYCGARIGEVTTCPYCNSNQWLQHLTDEEKHEKACDYAIKIEGGTLDE